MLSNLWQRGPGFLRPWYPARGYRRKSEWVSWWLDFNILSTTQGHLRTVKLRHKEMYLSKLFIHTCKPTPTSRSCWRQVYAPWIVSSGSNPGLRGHRPSQITHAVLYNPSERNYTSRNTTTTTKRADIHLLLKHDCMQRNIQRPPQKYCSEDLCLSVYLCVSQCVFVYVWVSLSLFKCSRDLNSPTLISRRVFEKFLKRAYDVVKSWLGAQV